MSTEIVFIKTGKEEINHNPFRVNLADRRDGQSLNRAMDIASIKLHNVNLDIIDEVRLSTNGPIKRQAKSNKHVLFRDFSIFC